MEGVKPKEGSDENEIERRHTGGDRMDRSCGCVCVWHIMRKKGA